MAEARLALAVTLVAGLLVGAGSAIVTMRHAMGPVGQGWLGSRVTGSVHADPWTRASVALTGLLALDKSQAIYFVRKTDNSGAALDEHCRYRVTGGPMPGRWWSVTAYAADNYLPQNRDGALSIDATRVRKDAAGFWQAVVAASLQPGADWISSRNAGHFDLTLRIYNPTAQAQRDFSAVPFPHVQRLDCAGGA